MRKLALIALLIVSPAALAEPALTNQQIARSAGVSLLSALPE